MRAQATLDGAAQQPVTTTALRKFAAKPASGYGSKVAAIAATVCVPWLRGSRLPTARSASWNRRAICSERSQPFSGAKSAAGGVRSSVQEWRKGWDGPPLFAQAIDFTAEYAILIFSSGTV